jgi:hypothetical protein
VVFESECVGGIDGIAKAIRNDGVDAVRDIGKILDEGLIVETISLGIEGNGNASIEVDGHECCSWDRYAWVYEDKCPVDCFVEIGNDFNASGCLVGCYFIIFEDVI